MICPICCDSGRNLESLGILSFLSSSHSPFPHTPNSVLKFLWFYLHIPWINSIFATPVLPPALPGSHPTFWKAVRTSQLASVLPAWLPYVPFSTQTLPFLYEKLEQVSLMLKTLHLFSAMLRTWPNPSLTPQVCKTLHVLALDSWSPAASLGCSCCVKLCWVLETSLVLSHTQGFCHHCASSLKKFFWPWSGSSVR